MLPLTQKVVQKLLFFWVCLVFYSCNTITSPNTDKLAPDSITIQSQKQEYIKEIYTDSIIQASQQQKIDTYILKKGETLWAIAETYYGNRHWSDILSIYNDIENVNTIKVGTSIKIPSFETLLKDSKLGLSTILEEELNKIITAHTLFTNHENELKELRLKMKGSIQVKLSTTTVADLKQASNLIYEATASLKNTKNDSAKVPGKIVRQLEYVAANLKQLSTGANDGYGYDLDMVHQNMVHAIKNGIAWAKNSYK